MNISVEVYLLQSGSVNPVAQTGYHYKSGCSSHGAEHELFQIVHMFVCVCVVPAATQCQRV
jgi:hypothetical protein|eukprot:SAG25_NODE_1913_length_2149_cov_1.493171_1_plen_61_part_00